jgi:hypothetical protein
MRRRYVRDDETYVTDEPRYVPVDGEPVSAGADEVVDESSTAVAPPSPVGLLSGLIAIAGLLVFAILSFRLGFMMGDANGSANFVDFIYRISGALVHPLQGIMRNRILDSGGVFEPATAYAMGIYLIATVLALLAVWAVMPRIVTRESTAVRHRSRIAHQH